MTTSRRSYVPVYEAARALRAELAGSEELRVLDPCRFLLAVARGEAVRVTYKSSTPVAVGRYVYPTIAQRIEAAKALAPYLPRAKRRVAT